METNSVYVFANTLNEAKKLLAPFDNSIQVPAYPKRVVTEDKIQRFRDWCKLNGYEIGYDITRLYNLKGDEWNNGIWVYDNTKNDWYEWSTANPRGKWTWYHLSYGPILWRSWRAHHSSPPDHFISSDGKWYSKAEAEDFEWKEFFYGLPFQYQAHVFIFQFSTERE